MQSQTDSRKTESQIRQQKVGARVRVPKDLTGARQTMRLERVGEVIHG